MSSLDIDANIEGASSAHGSKRKSDNVCADNDVRGGCGSRKRDRTRRKNSALATDNIETTAATVVTPITLCKPSTNFRTHTMKRVNKKSEAKLKGVWDAFDETQNGVLRDDVETVEMIGGERTECDKCSSSLRTTDDGFLVCPNKECSVVYTDVINHDAEWRCFPGDDSRGPDPTRCGMPSNPLLENSSYGCMLSASKGVMTKETWLMQRYVENQSASSKEKAMYREYQDIIRMAQKFGVTQYIIDDALLYTKMISEHRLQTRGNTRLGMIAGTLYMSFCKNGCPRTCGEIAAMCGITPKHATRGCNHVQELINHISGKSNRAAIDLEKRVDMGANANELVHAENDIDPNDATGGTTKSGPECFVSRYCSNLDMAPQLVKLCLFVVELILARGLLSGNTPHSIAAGVVYYVIVQCGLNKTPDDVVRVSKLSKATFVKCYKQMDSCGKQFIPKSILQQYRSA